MTPMQGIDSALCVFSLYLPSTKNGRIVSGFFSSVVSMRLRIKLLAPYSCDVALMSTSS